MYDVVPIKIFGRDERYSPNVLKVLRFTYDAAETAVATELPAVSVGEPLYLVMLTLPGATMSSPGPVLVAVSSCVALLSAPTPIAPGTHDGNPTTSRRLSFPVATKTATLLAVRDEIELIVLKSFEHRSRARFDWLIDTASMLYFDAFFETHSIAKSIVRLEC